MHMADALLSPVVGGTMLAAAAGIGGYSIKKIQSQLDEKKIPLMGVMGAFIFTAQMINFSIPGTGSSGHIGGGMLLAILLGPYAGFLTLASILFIQALFFADGGLLAFGANVFNLGFYTCFIAYPLIFKSFMKRRYSSKRLIAASIISSIIGLQLGAFSVVMQTVLSGKTELPFSTFVLLVQAIHLVIGAVEGIVTAIVVSFVWSARPEIIERSILNQYLDNTYVKKIVILIGVSALAIGGVLSLFASSNPDGLEWAIIKTSGNSELESQNNIQKKFSEIQHKLAILPDYGFKKSEQELIKEDYNKVETLPEANVETSASGIIGGIVVLLFVVINGVIVTLFKRKRKRASVNAQV